MVRGVSLFHFLVRHRCYGDPEQIRTACTASVSAKLPQSTTSPSNLSRWAAAGMIRIVHRPTRRGQAMLLLEHDVADLAAQYIPGRSRWNQPSLDKLPIAN